MKQFLILATVNTQLTPKAFTIEAEDMPHAHFKAKNNNTEITRILQITVYN